MAELRNREKSIDNNKEIELRAKRFSKHWSCDFYNLQNQE